MLTYSPRDSTDPSPPLLGGKAFHLACIEREARASEGFDIPAWFAITTEAFDQFVRPALEESPSPIDRPSRVREGSSETIQSLEFPTALREEIQWRLASQDDRLSSVSGPRFAVRSSAVNEDGAEHSFAGQYTTILGVSRDGIEEAVKSVWASLFSGHALDYAASAGHGGKEAIAVIIQEMVEPRVSGVAFSVDPVSGAKHSVISAVFGLGEGLVSGLLDADTFIVESEQVTSQIAVKHAAVRSASLIVGDQSGGTVIEALDEKLAQSSTLSDDEVRSIDRSVKFVERFYGVPQDVEWAMDEIGRLYLLQARPITAMARPAETILWDNSNIIESFSGTTTPLTFSFVNEVYREVYKQFVRVLGVPKHVIAEHDEIFSMLGYIRGRIYYNLANWYRVVSLLPFYEANAHFMEQMMGVSEGINVEPVQRKARGKLRSTGSSVGTIAKLLVRLARLSADTRAFHARLNSVLDKRRSIGLSSSASECLAHYNNLERELLRRWTTPIVNDFFVMVFFGTLRKVIAAWKLTGEGKDRSTAQADAMANDLISFEGGMISAEPGMEIVRIAREIERAGAHELFQSSDEAVLPALQHSAPVLASQIDSYIERFGDRWQHELKLETITPAEDASLLIGLLRSHLGERAEAAPITNNSADARLAAESNARRQLRNKPFKKILFFYILYQARKRIKARENLRFERTRVFSRVRAIYLQVGREFEREGIIDHARDIFFLTRIEIAVIVHGEDKSMDMRPIIVERKRALALFEDVQLPSRFRTDGVMADADRGRSEELRIVLEALIAMDGSLRGMGCAAGIVRGEVRIVRDPHASADLRGKIIVAERTDPGWAPIFPLAIGLLVERGSLLSHSAIVARELGLPTIVGIPNLLSLLADGDEVEFDGATGIIRKLEARVEKELAV